MFLHTLPNGLDVLVIEDNSVPLATIMITFKSGAFTEPKNYSGFSGIYQSMLFKGNKDYYNEQDFNYHSGELGIQLSNATSTQEYAANYFTLPTSNLEPGLNFMNTAIRFAKMDPEELEREKKKTDDQLKQKESSPFFALADAMDRHIWGELYNRKTAIGNHLTTQLASPELMDTIKNKYYYPNNAILIIGGDVAHDLVFGMVEKIYGSWKASNFDPFKKWPIPEFKPLVKPDYFIVESILARSPVINIQWQGPDTRGDLQSTYAADVFSYILNQKSSKLSTALVQSGLASSVSIGYTTLKHVGPISLLVTPNPLKIQACMDEIKRQIVLMDNDDYLSASQIETAKRMLEIKSINEEEITTDFVHSMAFWWASASLNYFGGYYDNLKKVSLADIKTYVRKYIKNRPYCAGLLISPQLNKQISAETFFTAN